MSLSKDLPFLIAIALVLAWIIAASLTTPWPEANIPDYVKSGRIEFELPETDFVIAPEPLIIFEQQKLEPPWLVIHNVQTSSEERWGKITIVSDKELSIDKKETNEWEITFK